MPERWIKTANCLAQSYVVSYSLLEPSRLLWYDISLTILQKTLKRLTTGRVSSNSEAFSDLSDETHAIIEMARPYTMTSRERMSAVVDAIDYIVRADIPGAVVECGVWRGGMMLAAAKSLLNRADTSRELYLFDTFEGMTSPGERDRRWDGTAADELMVGTTPGPEKNNIWCVADIDDVRANMARVAYPQDRITLVKGRVEDTIPAQAPEKIALLRLDTDWYESTRHELEYLVPRLSPRGVLIIDDYGHWKGVRQAVDEYFCDRPILLARTDYTGRMAVVP
jgi:O-methyltransferase